MNKIKFPTKAYIQDQYKAVSINLLRKTGATVTNENTVTNHDIYFSQENVLMAESVFLMLPRRYSNTLFTKQYRTFRMEICSLVYRIAKGISENDQVRVHT